MTEDKTASRRILTRMVIGGAIGFVSGFLVGMLVNPPFSGMTSSSADVQGLTYFTWVGFGVMWGVVGSLAGGGARFPKFESREEQIMNEYQAKLRKLGTALIVLGLLNKAVALAVMQGEAVVVR